MNKSTIEVREGSNQQIQAEVYRHYIEQAARQIIYENQASYKIPFVDVTVSHETVFQIQNQEPVFLRPADVERLYGIPISTIYDLIADQPTTQFPAIKLITSEGKKRHTVLIPKKLLDKWIIDHSTLKQCLPAKTN